MPALPRWRNPLRHLVWNAGQDLGAAFHGGVLLRARASDFGGMGVWSAPMFYLVDMIVDTDSDGMPDAWEIQHGLDPDCERRDWRHRFRLGSRTCLNSRSGLNPQSSSLIGVPLVFIGNAAGTPAAPNETGYLTMAVTRDPAAVALEFRVEISGDVTDWQFGSEHITVIENTPTLLKARDNKPALGESTRFIRLNVLTP